MNLSDLLIKEIRLEHKPQVCIQDLNLINIRPVLHKEVLSLVLSRYIFAPVLLQQTPQGIKAHSNIELLETLLYVSENQEALSPRNLVRRALEYYFSTITAEYGISDKDFENYSQMFKKLTVSNISS